MKTNRIRFCSGTVLPVIGHRWLTAGLLGLMVLFAGRASAERANSSDAFVDSVGINVHLHSRDTPYSNFPRVQQALQDLQVRHVRDGLIDTTWKEYYDRHNQLGRAGIKGIFITSPNQSEQLLLDYPRRMKDSFEGYEAPNEYDQGHDEHWPATMTSFLENLNQNVKSDSGTSRFPVIGPSLTRPDSFGKLRGLCSFDYANLHNYFAGRNPGTRGWGSNGYGSIAWNLSNVGALCNGKPVMTTETGYQTDAGSKQGIPEEVAARYVPRVFLEQWLRGIRRTYLYELIDLPSARSTGDTGFGLLRSDYSPKPAYSALMNLLRMLVDPGPAYATQELGFKLTGDLSDVHHLLLQKRNGVFYLALWLEESSYDIDGKKAISVPTHHVIVQNDKEVGMRQHVFDKSGAMQALALDNSSKHEVEVSDSVTVLEIDDGRPAAPLMNPPVVSHNVR
jgi:hypothetical protein